jgi:iron complex outermembrane receptor protein
MRPFIKKIICPLLISIPLFIDAQEKITELEGLTVTATLAAAQQKETGRNITVINGSLLSNLPVHSLDELLRYLPGIEVQQRGPQGSQSDIVIRGGTFQQVLLIIDGIKLNDPLTGHFNSYIPIHPGEIERIEILKGAASALYGSEAIGGVIHIITKTFSSQKATKNELQAGLTAGENNLINGNLHFRYAKNNSELSGGLLSNHADGEKLRGTTGFFDNTTASLAFAQRFKNNWQLNLRTAADFRHFNAQNFYTTFLSDTAKEKVHSFWQHAAIYKKTEKYSLTIDAGYKNLKDEFWFRPAATPNNNKTSLFNWQINYSRKLAARHSFTTGVQALHKKIISNDRGKHALWHAALFAIGQHKMGEKFYINESLRIDWDENYGWQLVPQINLSFALSKITLRASAGKGIRDADFTERYNNYNKALVTGGSIGNPQLEAEKSFSTEIGADYNLSGELKVSLTAFYRNQDNLIDWTPTPYADMPRKSNLSPTGNYALAKNIANVKTKGLELDLQYKKQFSKTVNLYSAAGVLFLDSDISDAVPSFYLSSHAKSLVNFNTILTVRSFSIALNGIYKTRKEQSSAAINAKINPSYFIMNAKIGYSALRNRLLFFFETDNIFDTSYSDLLGSKMPGQWLSGGFQVNLWP